MKQSIIDLIYSKHLNGPAIITRDLKQKIHWQRPFVLDDMVTAKLRSSLGSNIPDRWTYDICGFVFFDHQGYELCAAEAAEMMWFTCVEADICTIRPYAVTKEYYSNYPILKVCHAYYTCNTPKEEDKFQGIVIDYDDDFAVVVNLYGENVFSGVN